MFALPDRSPQQRPDAAPVATGGATALGRRAAVSGALAAPFLWRAGRAASPLVLKLGHPYPAAANDHGDFRDRLARRFADEVSRRTGGAIGFDLYPNASFTRSEASFSAVRHGALDMLIAPLSRAAADVPEAEIGTLPGLVTSYEQAAGWRDGAIGKLLGSALEKRGGARILCWIWTQGGIVSRSRAVTLPADLTGMSVRGGGQALDAQMAAAGGKVVSVAGPDLRDALAHGRIDAAIASATSLVSYGLRDVTHFLSYPDGGGPWFMLMPLMIAEPVFARLTKDQQEIVSTAGQGLEGFAFDAARADDTALPDVFREAGIATQALDQAAIDAWRSLARLSSWQQFAARNDRCAALLAAAQGPT